MPKQMFTQAPRQEWRPKGQEVAIITQPIGSTIDIESSAAGEMRKLRAEVEAGRSLSPTSEARLITLNDAEDNTTKINIKIMTMQGGKQFWRWIQGRPLGT